MAKTHFSFPYYFEGSEEGITFSDALEYKKDLLIYYNSLGGSDYIDCWCTGWSVNNYTFTLRTCMDKTDYDRLRGNIVPGAVGEMYRILGKPLYYDKTWNGENTIMIKPNDESLWGRMSNLHKMRNDVVLYVKLINEHPITDTLTELKIEGMVSGNSRL